MSVRIPLSFFIRQAEREQILTLNSQSQINRLVLVILPSGRTPEAHS